MKLKIVALEKTWAKAVWKSLVKPLGRRVNDSAKAVWRRHRDLLVVLAACSTFFLLVVIADSCALYRSGKVRILPCIHVSSCIVLAREEPCPDLWYSNVLYQNLFFGARAGRSRAFKGGAEANFFYLEPEPKKISGAEEKWFGSAKLLVTEKIVPVLEWIPVLFFTRKIKSFLSHS